MITGSCSRWRTSSDPSSIHHRNREAIVAFDPDGLQSGHRHARLSGEKLIQAAYAQDARILGCRVEHRALADDIVDDDQAPRARQAQRPGEVVRIAWLVGVD